MFREMNKYNLECGHVGGILALLSDSSFLCLYPLCTSITNPCDAVLYQLASCVIKSQVLSVPRVSLEK